LRKIFALLLSPVFANAGIVYDMTVRPIDQSDIGLASPNGPALPLVTHYFVEDEKVRVGGDDAKTVYIFKDQTMYVIDNTSRTVHVLKHQTLSQTAAHYADAVKQLEAAAASASPENRAEAQKKAADMKEVSDRLRRPVPHNYRVTVRVESVDGHACRVWEERERDDKRLELCVALVTAVSGGAEILSGMKTLSRFRQGSNFGLGVDFGLSEWWPDIATIGGVPVLIREYKYGSGISEVTLTAVRVRARDAALFDLPGGYQVQEGPDYAQWYVR